MSDEFTRFRLMKNGQFISRSLTKITTMDDISRAHEIKSIILNITYWFCFFIAMAFISHKLNDHKKSIKVNQQQKVSPQKGSRIDYKYLRGKIKGTITYKNFAPVPTDKYFMHRDAETIALIKMN